MTIRPRDPSKGNKILVPAAAKVNPPPRKRPSVQQIAAVPPPRPAPNPKRTGDNWNADGTYKVGDRKPPPGRRFRPGQSGNPNGRPKAKPSMDEIIIRTMEKKIVLTNSRGGTTKTTRVDALYLKFYEKAVKGDLKASIHLFNSYAEAKGRRSNGEGANDALSAAEQIMLANLLRNLGIDVPDDDTPEDDAPEGEPA